MKLMFGMTKKQFLKKSKACLKDTGVELLFIREIFIKEGTGKINEKEAREKMEIARKNTEKIFFKYEKLKPPSKCKQLHMNILKTLIILQETVVLNLEYLTLINHSSDELALKKYQESQENLEIFRENFRKLSQKIDKYLN
jgi:hypothetical protein